MSSSLLAKKRILVIGDIMLDVYIDGDVQRISPEAPVPVLDFKSSRSMAGAAANVAKNIVSLESEATLISIIGSDLSGRDLIAQIGKLPIVPYIKISKDRITTVKTRYMSHNHQILRMDNERKIPISDNMADEIFDLIKQESENHDAILISDYAKGLFSDYLLNKLCDFFKTLNIPMVVDSKNINYNNYAGVTLITPNTFELYNATGIHNVLDAAHYLIDTFGIKNILVTQGAHGMTLVMGDAKPYHIPAETSGVIDVTGAGDTVAAVMAIGLANSIDIIECMKMANNAAGIVVRKPGVATVTKEEMTWKPILH